MDVIRFKVTCQAGEVDKAIEVFKAVIAPSRQLAGVAAFDVARCLDDGNAIIATEVFDDADARERQEALAEVAQVMSILPNLLAGPPEATVYHVATAEPAM